MKKSFLIAPVAAMVLMTSCMNNKETATTFKSNEPEEAVKVKAKTVESREVAQLVEFTATVEANKTNGIAPQSPVRIRRVRVEVGAHVSAGEILVDLDDANLNQAKFRLDNQRVEFSRTDELYKIGGVSKSVWDASKMQLDLLESSYANLLENTTLKSPITGVVTARNYDAGDLYSGTPVYTVQQINPCKILLDVNEQYYSLIKVGTRIEKISLDAYPEETFEGRVSIIYPTINTQTRTFQVEITIPNQNERVRPGMFARVTLDLGNQQKVCVPDQAIVKQIGSGERFVYVIEGGKAYHKRVELGRRLGDEYVVNSGVVPGSSVVVFGQNLLADGRDVEVLN